MRLRWQGNTWGKDAAFGSSTHYLSPAFPRSELFVTLTGILGSIARDLQDQLSVGSARLTELVILADSTSRRSPLISSKPVSGPREKGPKDFGGLGRRFRTEVQEPQRDSTTQWSTAH